MGAGHVVLVGLMATGKTTIGRRVAKRLDRPFVDADGELEERTGVSVRELFEKEGEAMFRQLESELLAELLDAPEPHVIATGGGVVVTPANRQLLKRSGAFVVWLDADPAFLAYRAAGKTSRPLLDDDPLGTLTRLSAERTPWYGEVADVTMDIRPAFRDQENPKDHLSFVIARLVTEGDQVITVPVELGERSYDVVVGAGAREWLPSVLPTGAKRVALVTQASIGVDVDPGVEHRLFPIADGEGAKTLATVEELCRAWARWGLTRVDAVVAVGGGVVTDVAGFAAAVYHRGVAVVHVPTTLLGMVDAAIGGKTGVNLPEGKNLVGAFWQPTAVLCDTDVLATLPPRERRSGMGEMAKYHFLTGDDLMALSLDERVAACVRIKAAHVVADERETTGHALRSETLSRARLNYGHTLGHALETAGRYDLRHGEAVAIGLVYAAELARILGRISTERVDEHRAVVGSYDLPARLPDGCDPDELVNLFARDKKAVDGVTFVLDGPDGVEPVTGIDRTALLDALETLR